MRDAAGVTTSIRPASKRIPSNSIAPETTAERIANMVACRWLAVEGGRLIATGEGRGAARPLLAGILRMVDQGTRLVDVALMMTVLRLSQGELDDEPGFR